MTGGVWRGCEDAGIALELADAGEGQASSVTDGLAAVLGAGMRELVMAAGRRFRFCLGAGRSGCRGIASYRGEGVRGKVRRLRNRATVGFRRLIGFFRLSRSGRGRDDGLGS